MAQATTPFSTPLRVRFGETDAMGVANNAAYLQFFEIGRIEFLRACGHSYADVHNGGIDMVVAEASISYLRPLLFDDEFRVECTLAELSRASFRFGYRLLRGDEVVATGFTRHACVDRASLRPVRVPGWLAELGAGFTPPAS
jgi:acyl-CoA thioester hydrolase